MAMRRNQSASVGLLAVAAAVCAMFSMTTTFSHPFLHQRTEGETTEYWADVGYFADGTSIVKAGNAINHGEPGTPDPHTNGAPLVPSTYMANVGYFVDGTSIIRAGNALNHGEPGLPDPHTAGSALPSTPYAADIGYFVDGTDVTKAGNALNHA